MPLALRVSCAALLTLVACQTPAGSTTAGSATDTSTDATTGAPGTSTAPVDPTSGTGAAPTSTGPSTASTDASSTTGAPPPSCAGHTDASACGLAGCDWIQVVGYTHGTQGCQGDIRDFCVPKDSSGGLTSVWKDEGGDVDVLQFGFDPTDLGPEWNECDCDGPLACLCTAVALDCPARLDDFCGLITGENGCGNAAAAGELVCHWFTVSQEGPLDGMCDDPPWGQVCLPATKLGADSCDPISLPYVDKGYCQGWTDPVFWRDRDGVIEVTTNCGPEPLGWTLCVADDPDQPEECKCGCKI